MVCCGSGSDAFMGSIWYERVLYERVRSELFTLGGKTSLYDEAMYLWHSEDCRLEGFIDTHVDDFVYGGTDEWHEKVSDKVMNQFR